MKRAILVAVAGVLLFAGAGRAQSASPTAPLQHFTLSGNAVGFLGAAGGAPQSASLAGASFNLTQRFSLGYELITVPSVASYNFGTVGYTLPLSSLVGKTINSHFTFDATKVNVEFMGGLGKVSQSALNLSRIAETVGAYISYPLSNNVSIQIIGAQWLHGGITGTSGFVTSTNSSTAALSSGLLINF
jgi:hypothetical protein